MAVIKVDNCDGVAEQSRIPAGEDDSTNKNPNTEVSVAGTADGQWMELAGLVEDHNTEVSAINGGLTESVMDQGQLNQVEISNGSYQMKSEGGIQKLTLTQKRENKRPSDYRTAYELTAENKHSKAENEWFMAENTLLKSLLDSVVSDGRDENCDSKAEAEPSSGSGQTLEQKDKPSEPPTQDYIHSQARRAQAIACHKVIT
ncbi:hypothetical protein V6N13_049826 [Hibiscus sabdariffa]|uniref:Uncharacterized protein n=2 Tax=Hibiscus sabdariffa TaxID=183260 RepID=A0ABR2QW37_9ROSI